MSAESLLGENGSNRIIDQSMMYTELWNCMDWLVSERVLDIPATSLDSCGLENRSQIWKADLNHDRRLWLYELREATSSLWVSDDHLWNEKYHIYYHILWGLIEVVYMLWTEDLCPLRNSYVEIITSHITVLVPLDQIA